MSVDGTATIPRALPIRIEVRAATGTHISFAAR
jgi:hypothetical protein